MCIRDRYKTVGANAGTFLLELGAHLNHARERVVLIDPLIVGKDGVAAQTLIVILIEFQDGIVLRSTVLNAALHHGIVKVNISIVATEVAVKLFLKAFADSVHYAVMVTNRHPALIVTKEISLPLAQFRTRHFQHLVNRHLELAHGILVCVFYVCVILLHQSRVDNTHEVWLLVCDETLIESAPFRVFDCIGAMSVVPLTRHRLGNNAFRFVDGILLKKLSAPVSYTHLTLPTKLEV